MSAWQTFVSFVSEVYSGGKLWYTKFNLILIRAVFTVRPRSDLYADGGARAAALAPAFK